VARAASQGHEQVMPAFNASGPAAQVVPLALDDPQNETAKRGERTSPNS
jgi:hypothetical protein